MLFKLCVCLLLINFGHLADATKIAAAKIPRGPLVEGNAIRVQAIIPEGAKLFKIRLQQGGEDDDKTEIILGVEVNLGSDEIAICAKKDGKELKEMKYKNVVDHDKPDSMAEILIATEKDKFEININGHYAEFPVMKKQIPLKDIDHVVVMGDVDIELMVMKSVSKKDLQKLEKK